MQKTSNPLRFTPRGFAPTAEQNAIQLSQHPVTLIEANAGAAKTTTLALRIGEALARRLVPEQILALVFTPEAKEVMRSRLVEIGIPPFTVAKIRVSTFDEFASDVLLTIEGQKTLQLHSVKDLKPQALQAIEQVSLSYFDYTDALDIRTHNVAISQFLECQLHLKATMALDGDPENAGLIEAAERLGVPFTDYLWALEYERIRLGTFDEAQFRGPFDASYDLARQLGAYPDTRNALPSFSLVVGDELHDLNEASFRILTALLDMDKTYFVGAGDKDQVIHSSLGASEEFLSHRFSDRYPGCAQYPLTMTYRHGPELAYAIAAFKDKPVESGSPESTEITQLHYSDANDCAARVVEAIKKWTSTKNSLEGCAILLRDRHQSVPIENALMQAGVPYRTHGMQASLQREEILFLRGMVAISLKNLVSVQSLDVRKAIIESLAIFGELAFSASDMEFAKTAVARDPDMLASFFSGQIQRSESAHASARISAAVSFIQDADPDTPAHLILRKICDKMDIEALAKRIYVHSHDAAVIAKSVNGFIDGAAKSGMNLREFSEWIGTADAFIAGRRSKKMVLLECVADSKGKEYDHVIMPFLELGEFPVATGAAAEEENLFYVGATRAKLQLSLITPKDEDLRSPFIGRMALASSRSRANSALRKNRARDSNAALRTDLSVAYADKDVVKAMGAKWDTTRKVWYVPAGEDAQPFKPWFRKG